MEKPKQPYIAIDSTDIEVSIALIDLLWLLKVTDIRSRDAWNYYVATLLGTSVGSVS